MYRLVVATVITIASHATVSASKQDMSVSDPLFKRPALKLAISASKKDQKDEVRRLLRKISTTRTSQILDRWAAHALLGVMAYQKNQPAEARKELALAAYLFPKTGVRNDYWLQEVTVQANNALIPLPKDQAFKTTFASASQVLSTPVGLEKLRSLAADAAKSQSTAIQVWVDGKTILEGHRGRTEAPIPLASITKSISSLAIMILLDERKIRSLDEPLTSIFDEWSNIPLSAPVAIRRRREITLRSILNHTSGIQTDYSDGKIVEQPSSVQYALNSPVIQEPGKVFNYNNRAANLVSGVVRRLTGIRLQDYLRKHIFLPLGITEYSWLADSVGNAYVYGGLSMKASDLAKIGQLLLDGGMWHGKRYIGEKTVREFTQVSSQYLAARCALFWWMDVAQLNYRINEAQLAQWRNEGISELTLSKLSRSNDKFLPPGVIQDIIRSDFTDEPSFTKWWQSSNWSKADAVSDSDPSGFNANGSLGQYLVVVPKYRIVAVRLIEDRRYRGPSDDFGDFIQRIPLLAESDSK